MTDRKLFHDCMCCGAWSFLVGELTCKVDSGNERDLRVLKVVISVRVVG